MSGIAGWDATIHAPHRLRICALLDDVKELEFAVLRDTLSLSDSVLSKQLAVLAEAGYLASRRAKRNRRQRVWLALTSEGRRAFAAHVAALRTVVGHEEQSTASLARPSVSASAIIGPTLDTGRANELRSG